MGTSYTRLFIFIILLGLPSVKATCQGQEKSAICHNSAIELRNSSAFWITADTSKFSSGGVCPVFRKDVGRHQGGRIVCEGRRCFAEPLCFRFGGQLDVPEHCRDRSTGTGIH